MHRSPPSFSGPPCYRCSLFLSLLLQRISYCTSLASNPEFTYSFVSLLHSGSSLIHNFLWTRAGPGATFSLFVKYFYPFGVCTSSFQPHFPTLLRISALAPIHCVTSSYSSLCSIPRVAHPFWVSIMNPTLIQLRIRFFFDSFHLNFHAQRFYRGSHCQLAPKKASYHLENYSFKEN